LTRAKIVLVITFKRKNKMADTSTLTTDPFFALTGQVTGVREKISDSIFENYKLQVAQTNDINNRAVQTANDINNRAMQVALHDATALTDLKAATSEGTLQNMLAAERTNAKVAEASLQAMLAAERTNAKVAESALQLMLASGRTDAAIGATAAATQRAIFEQGEITRGLINGINTQNLNTALINTNTFLAGVGTQYAGLGLAYGGAVAAYQSANQVSAINSLGSAISSQGQNVVGAGAVGGAQTATPTSIS
jgi:hypothetical protein